MERRAARSTKRTYTYGITAPEDDQHTYGYAAFEEFVEIEQQKLKAVQDYRMPGLEFGGGNCQWNVR